jgi:hypothetical protein
MISAALFAIFLSAAPQEMVIPRGPFFRLF